MVSITSASSSRNVPSTRGSRQMFGIAVGCFRAISRRRAERQLVWVSPGKDSRSNPCEARLVRCTSTYWLAAARPFVDEFVAVTGSGASAPCVPMRSIRDVSNRFGRCDLRNVCRTINELKCRAPSEASSCPAVHRQLKMISKLAIRRSTSRGQRPRCSRSVPSFHRSRSFRRRSPSRGSARCCGCRGSRYSWAPEMAALW